MMQFKPGDKAVCPGHGVGEVMGIETKTVAGQKGLFYVIQIIDNSMVIMIPTGQVGRQRLRGIISSEEAETVYTILRVRDIPSDNQTWNRRYREYTEKIKSGDPFSIAAVMRDLSLLKRDKDLSFGERKLLDTARNLLVKELALAWEKTEHEIEAEMTAILSPPN